MKYLLQKRQVVPGLGTNQVGPVQQIKPKEAIVRQARPFVPQKPGSKVKELPTADYLSIQVANADTSDATLVLFDANGAYASNNGYTKPGTLTITGISKNYTVLVNRLSNLGFRVHKITYKVVAGTSAQFDNTIDIYKDSMLSNRSIYVNTFYPAKGEHSGQFQTTIQEFPADFLVEQGTALVTTIAASTTVVLRFHIGEEVGRHQ